MEVTPLFSHSVEPFLRLGIARRVRRHHRIAQRRELQADRFPQPTHAAGHQRYAVLVLRHFVFLLDVDVRRRMGS